MTNQSHAPARVDLAGGTLDIWPLYLFHENSQTVNFAINCYARCRITPHRSKTIQLISRDLNRSETFASLGALRQAKRWKLPLLARLVLAFAESEPRPQGSGGGLISGGLTLETDSGVPAGSGLGGSSALNIAICGALSKLTGKRLTPEKMIELAGNVEAQVLGVPTGKQDYYSAMFGGLQSIHLTPYGIVPEKLAVSADAINSHFVLCYTGQSRNSGINNWEVEKAHLDGNRAVIRHFGRIAAIAADMRQALKENNWDAVASLLRQEWAARKKNHPGISTPTMEKQIAAASRRGALAAKACGAGGGGCVVFLVEPERKQDVKMALRGAGARLIPFRMSARGLSVRSGS